ncbi:hypothetical protein BH24ACT14_BH24ACT14_20030 [soil metagenome]
MLAAHHRLVRSQISAHRGREVDTQGDAFFVAFSHAGDALDAAVGIQRDLLAEPWPDGEALLVRMGIHTGQPVVLDDHYIGIDIHRAARICSAAHGGQIVASRSSRDEVDAGAENPMSFRELGSHRLKDLRRA